jgi:prevent-host-death family protein
MSRIIGSYEAKTHLPRLLDEVAGGESITITKHGVPVALLVPPVATGTSSARDAVAGLREFRSRHRLEGVTVRELIDEGRR